MTDPTSWIVGLMRHNSNELGFIPEPTVRGRYVKKERYVLQRDVRGRNVGYILHGAVKKDQLVVISQACIDMERRMRGFGQVAVEEVVRRCEREGAVGIRGRCAHTLEAVGFWERMGFRIVGVSPGGRGRGNLIVTMVKNIREGGLTGATPHVYNMLRHEETQDQSNDGAVHGEGSPAA